MLHHKDDDRFPPDVMLGIQAKEFNLGFIRPESFRCLLAKSGAADMVVLLEGSPISTEEQWSSFRVTIGDLVTSLTKALLPRLLSSRMSWWFQTSYI